MCELLAYTSKGGHQVNSLLKAFYKRSDEHPHGWGLGLFSDKIEVEKEPIKATESEKLKEILSNPLSTSALMAHIRYATTGHFKQENTHPFVAVDDSGRKWVLMHNGTIINGPELEIYEEQQKGETDSERILLLLIDRINDAYHKNGDLNHLERFQIISETISALARDKNKLNIVIYDGDIIYAHTNAHNQLYYTKDGDELILSTYPLELEGRTFKWEELPITHVHAFKDGEWLYSNVESGIEYIPDPEIEKYLYYKYASL